MRGRVLLPVGLLCVGAALIGLALARGQATVGLVLVFPVVYGSSALLAGGVVLIAIGLLTLPLAVAELGEPEPAAAGRGTGPASPPSWSGVVLVGPLPIFLGGWSTVPRWVRVSAAVVGAAVLAVLLLWGLGVLR